MSDKTGTLLNLDKHGVGVVSFQQTETPEQVSRNIWRLVRHVGTREAVNNMTCSLLTAHTDEFDTCIDELESIQDEKIQIAGARLYPVGIEIRHPVSGKTLKSLPPDEVRKMVREQFEG